MSEIRTEYPLSLLLLIVMLESETKTVKQKYGSKTKKIMVYLEHLRKSTNKQWK